MSGDFPIIDIAAVRQPQVSAADRAQRFVKAELKRAEVSYAELARRLKKHGLEETEGVDHGKA
jgi:hypothetical protein